MRDLYFNQDKKHKPHGCRTCEHNHMGICELCDRELPLGCTLGNLVPKWCPKKGGKK